MKIGIIGAGAVGMLFGAYLSEVGNDITFYVREKHKTELFYIEKKQGIRELIECKQVSEIEALHCMDLIIIAVKYHHLEQLKDTLQALPIHIPLLFIQNGLLHVPFANKLQQNTIIIGSVLHGVTKVNACTIRHLGVGVTSVGIYKGIFKMEDEFLRSASNKFPLKYTTNIEAVLFKKAMLNCLINPLTTILQVQNGMLIKNESYKSILKIMYDELIAAFDHWKEAFVWDEVVDLCKNTEYNRSSMLTDYENGRLMEIETIVGAVLAEAQKIEKALPVLRTFYLLLKEMNEVGGRNY